MGESNLSHKEAENSLQVNLCFYKQFMELFFEYRLGEYTVYVDLRVSHFQKPSARISRNHADKRHHKIFIRLVSDHFTDLRAVLETVCIRHAVVHQNERKKACGLDLLVVDSLVLFVSCQILFCLLVARFRFVCQLP